MGGHKGPQGGGGNSLARVRRFYGLTDKEVEEAGGVLTIGQAKSLSRAKRRASTNAASVAARNRGGSIARYRAALSEHNVKTIAANRPRSLLQRIAEGVRSLFRRR